MTKHFKFLKQPLTTQGAIRSKVSSHVQCPSSVKNNAESVAGMLWIPTSGTSLPHFVLFDISLCPS
jgi:hypothetical protein